MNTPMPTIVPRSFIVEGNRMLCEKRYENAIRLYIQALRATPLLAKTIDVNIGVAKSRYQYERQSLSRQRVAVCGWELAHNAAERVYTLANLYDTFTDVEIIGATFPKYGRDVSGLVRNSSLPHHIFVVEDQTRFVEQAIDLVSNYPYDIVHLSKPRASNIFFGILYKLIWGAKVLVDIDDEELDFVDAEPSLDFSDYMKDRGKLPELQNLSGKEWTRIAVELAQEFDGITVSTPVLQQRYSGEIIYPTQDNKSKLKKCIENTYKCNNQLSQSFQKIISHAQDGCDFPIAGMAQFFQLSKSRKQNFLSITTENIQSTHLKERNSSPIPPQAIAAIHSRKLPITVLVVTWDVGHNPLGRAYMLAEVIQRVARHSLLVGFQFPRFGTDIWEPVRNGKLPIITLPGSNLPEFHTSLEKISQRIRPDVVIACKPRLPSVELGLMIKERWNCPLIIDIDDHELSFFKNREELPLSDLATMPEGFAAKEIEPYAEIWTRLTHTLCQSADEIIVSNVALQKEFGGTIVPHVRDENTFDPDRYNGAEVRRHYDVPQDAKVVLFFGTPRVHKGVDKLAQAVNRIADPRFRLLVVGTAPDRSVTVKLDSMAPGRVIYLPNQPFSAIPEILSMADIVCLPQDEEHAISKYQLPAKAIDAVAMGVPLLVSHTAPLMQLVKDGVAELVDVGEIAAALKRLGGTPERVSQWRKTVRDRFLRHYSYAAATQLMREVIQRSLARKPRATPLDTQLLIKLSRRALGLTGAASLSPKQAGRDVVVFWKQNDTCLYGRRHDMVIKYLASRPDVRKVIVFDAPISEYDLIKKQQAAVGPNQDRWIYVGTYEKMLGVLDTPKISYNVFAYPPGKFASTPNDNTKPQMQEGYFPYITQVLKREGVEAGKSIFWIYPKNYLAPGLINTFKPSKIVVDVVDDHRAWPNVSESEKIKLTKNYQETLALADMAFTNCEPVRNSMKEFHPHIRMIPNGCDSTPLVVAPKNSREYDDFCKWPGKTIGYIGNLESKIDVELIEKLAKRFSDCQIVLIGSTHANPAVLQLRAYPNVKMPGVVPYAEAGAWVSRFDVGIVPHLKSDLTNNMNPLKVYVYWSFNVPVVCTEISNIDLTNEMLFVAANHDDFIAAVSATLSPRCPKGDVSARYVADNSWERRLSSHIDELLATGA